MPLDTLVTTWAQPDPAALIDRVHREMAAQELAVAARPGPALDCDTGIGMLRFRCAPEGLRIEIEAEDAGNLHMLRESLCARLDALAGQPVALQWEGAATPQKGLPPNVRIARVLARRRVTPRFLRLRLGAEGLAPFARSGLHLRLMIPPEGRAPVWPRLGENGRTIWPEGADALHLPAYTIRAIDAEAGWLDVDIFQHGRGRTCRWAEEVPLGAPVGLSGPGGGWLPGGSDWLLAGDETALPALARILETAPEEARGTCLIEVQSPEEIQPLSPPSGLTLRWLCRDQGDPDLLAALAEAPLPSGPEAFLWFAAEKTRTAEARQLLRAAPGVEKRQRYIGAYWIETHS
ncbi:siderophore-interacting protein [Roseivivax sp.]